MVVETARSSRSIDPHRRLDTGSPSIISVSSSSTATNARALSGTARKPIIVESSDEDRPRRSAQSPRLSGLHSVPARQNAIAGPSRLSANHKSRAVKEEPMPSSTEGRLHSTHHPPPNVRLASPAKHSERNLTAIPVRPVPLAARRSRESTALTPTKRVSPTFKPREAIVIPPPSLYPGRSPQPVKQEIAGDRAQIVSGSTPSNLSAEIVMDSAALKQSAKRERAGGGAFGSHGKRFRPISPSADSEAAIPPPHTEKKRFGGRETGSISIASKPLVPLASLGGLSRTSVAPEQSIASKTQTPLSRPADPSRPLVAPVPPGSKKRAKIGDRPVARSRHDHHSSPATSFTSDRRELAPIPVPKKGTYEFDTAFAAPNLSKRPMSTAAASRPNRTRHLPGQYTLPAADTPIYDWPSTQGVTRAAPRLTSGQNGTSIDTQHNSPNNGRPSSQKPNILEAPGSPAKTGIDRQEVSPLNHGKHIASSSLSSVQRGDNDSAVSDSSSVVTLRIRSSGTEAVDDMLLEDEQPSQEAPFIRIDAPAEADNRGPETYDDPMAEFEDFQFDFATPNPGESVSRRSLASPQTLRKTPSWKGSDLPISVRTPDGGQQILVPIPPHTAPIRRLAGIARSDILVSPSVRKVRRLSSTAQVSNSPKTARQLFTGLLQERARRQAQARKADQERLLAAEDARREQEIVLRAAEREARQRRAAEIQAEARLLDDDDEMEDENEQLLARLQQSIKPSSPRNGLPVNQVLQAAEDAQTTYSATPSPSKRPLTVNDKGWRRLNAVIEREEKLWGPVHKKARNTQAAAENPYPTPETESELSRAPSDSEDAAATDEAVAATAARFGMDEAMVDALDEKERVDVFWATEVPPQASNQHADFLSGLDDQVRPGPILSALLPGIAGPSVSAVQTQTLPMLLATGALNEDLRRPSAVAWLAFKLLSIAFCGQHQNIAQAWMAIQSYQYLIAEFDLGHCRDAIPLDEICRAVLAALGARQDIWDEARLAPTIGPNGPDRVTACHMLCEVISVWSRRQWPTPADAKSLIPALLLLSVDDRSAPALRLKIRQTVDVMWRVWLDDCSVPGAAMHLAERFRSYSDNVHARLLKAMGQASTGAIEISRWLAVAFMFPNAIPQLDMSVDQARPKVMLVWRMATEIVESLTGKADGKRLRHILTFLIAAMGDIAGLEATADRAADGSSTLQPLRGELQKAYNRCPMQRGMTDLNQVRSRLSQAAVAVKQHIELREMREANKQANGGGGGQTKLNFRILPKTSGAVH